MKLHAPAARALPPFLVEMLNHPPKAGSGVHVWLYSVARQLHAHFSLSADRRAPE